MVGDKLCDKNFAKNFKINYFNIGKKKKILNQYFK